MPRRRLRGKQPAPSGSPEFEVLSFSFPPPLPCPRLVSCSSRRRSRSPRPDNDVDVACALSDQELQQALWNAASDRFVHCAICEQAVERGRSERLSMDDLNDACRKVPCPWPLCVDRRCHATARNRWIDFCLKSATEEEDFCTGERSGGSGQL